MIRLAIVFTLALAFVSAASAQHYDVTFPNAAHHEAEITIAFTDIPRAPLQVRMSRSSPGRYAVHEFGKNVYDVRAVDGRGQPLAIHRPDPYQWDIVDHDGTVTVSYRLFADRAGGTYSQVDETHAHLNIPSSFMWARGLEDRPITVSFHPPAESNWKAATQLFPTDAPMTFTAPDFQYFMDSPTELSDHAVREWRVTSGGRTETMRLAVHHLGTEAEVDRFADMAKAVVAEEIAVFGEPPAFDVGYYTFIADYLPWASGDGMEHRNSTILSSTASLERAALGLLGTVSHEFFHAWNVERIRPRTLEPFDFERANMSQELWFAEGFTSYYTPLFIRRAGFTTDEQYAGSISGGLNFVINSPARQFFSAVEMSMQAPFVDAASSIDPVNRQNTFISYYTWGSVIGLNLDLTLRQRFDRTLDDYMRFVWERFAKPEIPYTVGELDAALGDFTGDRRFARDFFDRYVRGSDVPDYAALLAPAGFLLRPARPDAATLGAADMDFAEAGATLTTGTTIGTPLYDAGLDRNDRIMSIDGRRIRSREDLTVSLRDKSSGQLVRVEYFGHDRTRTVDVALAQDPTLEVVTYEGAGRTVTDDMRAFRAAWLGSRSEK